MGAQPSPAPRGQRQSSSSLSVEDKSASPPDAGSKDRKPLTDLEKKENHINSEKKRRDAIRAGFDRITRVVPGLEGLARSEALVLKTTIEFLEAQLEENEALARDLESRGIPVEERLKMFKSKEGRPPQPDVETGG